MAALTVDFRKHSGPTPADDMAAQNITDCGNFTQDFKQRGSCASPLFLQTLGPWFPNEMQNLLSSGLMFCNATTVWTVRLNSQNRIHANFTSLRSAVLNSALHIMSRVWNWNWEKWKIEKNWERKTTKSCYHFFAHAGHTKISDLSNKSELSSNGCSVNLAIVCLIKRVTAYLSQTSQLIVSIIHVGQSHE